MSSATDDLRDQLRVAVQRDAENGWVLASGRHTSWILDAQPTICAEPDVVAAAVMELPEVNTLLFNSVGGPVVGGFAMGLALGTIYRYRSFGVRKNPKGHGIGGLVVGALQPGDRVLILDDVVTSAGSLLHAVQEVHRCGATVVLAACLLYRGDAPVDSLALPDHDHRTEAASVPFRYLFRPADLGVTDA